MRVINKILILILIFAICFACNVGFYMASSEDNILESVCPIIENGSFEQKKTIDGTGENAIETIANWDFLSPIDYKNAQFVSSDAYDGENYYKLANGDYLLRTTNYIEIDEKSDYIFGIKFMTSDIDNICKISIERYDEGYNLIDTIEGENAKAVKQERWTDTSVYLGKDQSVKAIKIVIELKTSQGWMGIDKVYGNKDFISVFKGASIRLELGSPAIPEIRFFGSVDKEIFDKFSDRYDCVDVGIMIMPTKYLQEIGDYTFKSVSDAGKQASLIDSAYWTNMDTLDQDEFYNFNAVMKLNSSTLNFELCYRAYIRFSEQGKEEIIYSPFNIVDNSRSLQQVAIMAQEDKMNYDKYDDEQKGILGAYVENRMPQR